ncbi:MAG: plastocyanin/azurin family copper-binding protein [Chitinophagaceae bacterium]
MSITFGVAITLFTLSGCSGSSNQQNTPASADQSAAANGFTPNAVDNTHHNTDTVQIKAMAFSPANITIAKGDTVYWINNDVVAHDVSQFPDRTWKSALLQPHESFSRVFDDSSSYYCSIHPTMLGKVLMK